MSDTTPHDENPTPSTDAGAQAPESPQAEQADYVQTPPGYSQIDYSAANDTQSIDPIDPNAEYPAPVAAETVKRETYVPASTVTEATAIDGAATLADAPVVSSAPAAAEAPVVADTLIVAPEYSNAAAATTNPAFAPAAASIATPIYVQAPTPPKDKGNRAGGILIALLATVAFVVIYAIAVFVIAAITSFTAEQATDTFAAFIVLPVFYIPIIFFFLAFSALIAIVNRGGWWAYVLFGFLVGVVVYFSYIGGALLTVSAWNLTPTEATQFLSTQWLNPGAIAAAIIAREIPIWFGAWIANRGRKVTARNVEARRDYDRQLAEGPQLTRPA